MHRFRAVKLTEKRKKKREAPMGSAVLKLRRARGGWEWERKGDLRRKGEKRLSFLLSPSHPAPLTAFFSDHASLFFLPYFYSIHLYFCILPLSVLISIFLCNKIHYFVFYTKDACGGGS